METLVAEIIDFIFGFLGKIVWQLIRYPFNSKYELSRGGYQALGLITFIFLLIGSFLILGYFHE
jgi:hypothetical protein